ASTFLNSIKKNNLKKIVKAFDANKDKWNKFLQNTRIEICNPSIKNLQDIDCLVMIMPICEDLVYNNEILEFIKSGFNGKILKTVDCSIYL
ncbi:TPA: hypothetical protein R1738_001419, partial [Campylobacter lari]|nr:hypothetical protein [Campylobacter lari]